jgi:hypothetical protein
MARIRSIHPGLFTDEAFMSASAFARLLIIGIWCEAHDDGVFEWKPLTLKARIFPVDAVEVPALLDELVSLGFVKQFTSSGKSYGAIRNFRKFQRPKSPNASGVLPDDFRNYVGLDQGNSEPVPNHFPNASEKSPQMEDGGGRMKVKGKDEGEEKGGERASARGRPPRKFPLELDWQPSAETIERCNALGLTEQEVTAQAVVFGTWHRSRGEERADWQEAFVLWCQREAGKLGRKPGKPPEPRETVYIRQLDEEWPIYAEAWKSRKGRSPPTDRDGGWHFPADILQTVTSH